MSLVSKEDRIRLRSELYAKGEIDIDQFYSLEKESLEEEELESNESKRKGLSLSDLDELKRSEEAEISTSTPSDAPLVGTTDEDLQSFDLGLVGSNTDDRKEAFRSVLKSITKEEFNALNIYEQQRLYDFDPEAVRKIVGKEKSLHEEPKKKFSPDLTVEEFRKMSLEDLNDLYDSNPDHYNSLVEEERSGRTL